MLSMIRSIVQRGFHPEAARTLDESVMYIRTSPGLVVGTVPTAIVFPVACRHRLVNSINETLQSGPPPTL